MESVGQKIGEKTVLFGKGRFYSIQTAFLFGCQKGHMTLCLIQKSQNLMSHDVRILFWILLLDVFFLTGKKLKS